MRNPLRAVQKAVAAATLLAYCPWAAGGDILAPAASRAPAAASAASAAEAARAAARAAAGSGAAPATSHPLRQAMDAVRAWQGRQDAARAALAPSPGDPPEGLLPGGLEVAPGAAPGSPQWQGAELPFWIADGERTAVTVKQNQPQAILSWKTFNVGRSTDLHFDQRGGGTSAGEWVALNRVADPAGLPSRILGSIRAEGQVYLINRNGILFGGSSQVNVSTLVASSLDLAGASAEERDARLGNLRTVTFERQGPDGGAVRVEPGARLGAASRGRLLLLGGQVANGGALEVADGQVLLAAGASVALTPAAGRWYAPPDVTPGGASAGRVENTGTISARRGNVTLVGTDVRQDGLVTATTSAAADGSIWLGSRSSSAPVSISFGSGGTTQILPDGDGKTLVGSATFTPSRLDAFGERIVLQDGSTVFVPSGQVTLATTLHGNDPALADDTRIYLGAGARLDVSGLRDVEVAMEQNEIKAELRASELADNPVLRVGPLRSRTVYFDARQGAKLRNGTGIANLGGYYGLVERGIEQLMTPGGLLELASNAVVTRPGSLVDLSGGSVRYRDGWLRGSSVIDPTGRRVALEDAVAGVRYAGLDGDTVVDHARWGVTQTFSSPLSGVRPRFERGYVEGAAAGRLTLRTNDLPGFLKGQGIPDPAATGAFRILEGEVRAGTVTGPRQRELAGALDASDPTQAWRMRPAGAALTLQRSGDVVITAEPVDLGPFGPDDPLAGADLLRYRHVLPARWFDGRTFTQVSIDSGATSDVRLDDLGRPVPGQPPTRNFAPGGNLTIGAGVVVDLGDGGSFSFTGKRAEIDGVLLAPGGRVAIETLQLPFGMTGAEATLAGLLPAVRLGPSGAIDVAGRWSNDLLDGPGLPLRALHGGAVTLTGSQVALDRGSLVDVSGGGRLDAAGTSLTSGRGGAITIDLSREAFTSREAEAGGAPSERWALDGTLRGHAPGTGGSLSLVTRRDMIVGDRLPSGAGPSFHLLTPGTFGQGGFSSFRIGGRSVTVAAGAAVALEVESLLLPSWIPELGGGVKLADVAPRGVVRDAGGNALPTSLELSASGFGGQAVAPVTLEAGSSLRLGPGSTVRLSGTAPAVEDGAATVALRAGAVVEAPGGRIELLAAPNPQAGAADAGTVVLEAGSKLLAGGWRKAVQDRELLRRSVERAGSVVLAPRSGDFALFAAQVDPGAEIDLAGIHGLADLPTSSGAGAGARYQAVEVDGDAGSLAISASRGLLAGTLRLAPGGPTGRGGSLELRGPSGILVTPDAVAARPGKLTLSARTIDAAGADHLVLKALSSRNEILRDGGSEVAFEGEVALTARRSLALLAPIVGSDLQAGAAVRLEADAVQIRGLSRSYVANDPDPRVFARLDAPLSELFVRADVIDLGGYVTLGCRTAGCQAGGFRTARFVAAGDIRLSNDVLFSRDNVAGLVSPGTLELEASQVYVTSTLQGSQSFVLERGPEQPGYLLRSDSLIRVTGNGADAPVPLSFGERLTLRALRIEQRGVLRAPQGQIRLEARDWAGTPGEIVLGPAAGGSGRSLTSASLEGAMIPFGTVTTRGEFLGYDRPGAAPTKAVSLEGASVVVEPGATIDVSGGGDLLGFRFAPGNGGSRDPLSEPGTFAVLPGRGRAPAPLGGVDALRDGGLRVGDAVHLQGLPGLADGTYTLLPAHYALLPGGLAVRPLEGASASPSAPFLQPDGSLVASGYLAAIGTRGGAAREAGYRRFAVLPRQAFSQYGEISLYGFDGVARARDAAAGLVVRTPGDAGTASVSATGELRLLGAGRFGAGPDGLLGNLDVSAPRIAVLGAGRTAPDAGYLALDLDGLNAFGAGSVLLGGTRAPSIEPGRPPATAVTVNATDLFVDTGAGAWTAPEILLAAGGSVRIADGSTLQARGAVSRDLSSLLVRNGPGISQTFGTADGALLRLSTGARVEEIRAFGPGEVRGRSGTLAVGTATLSADGSLALDGSRGVELAPGAQATGRQLDLSSARINLGDVPEADRALGTTLGREALARLAAPSDVLLRGYDAVHLYLAGDLTLGARDGTGAATLRNLTFDTGLLQGHAAAGQTARVTAATLTLRNGGAAGGNGAPGPGALALDADVVHLGPGDLRLRGYEALSVVAGGLEVRGEGSLDFPGSALLQAGRLQAAPAARYAMAFVGDATLGTGLSPGPGPAPAPGEPGLGAWLSLTGAAVAVDTAVLLPGGTFEATALSGTLRIGPGGAVDLTGRAVDFGDQVRFAPGGALRLSAAGDLLVEGGARLDASGSARGGDAGSIELQAGGRATIDGVLAGAAAGGARGGFFSLDSGTLADLPALLAALEGGGFTEARRLRLRQQDLALAQGERITAHEVLLRSDQGTVTLAGTIDAAGRAGQPDGGRITLTGGAGVLVQGTLDARAFAGPLPEGAFAPHGGKVELAAGGGRVALAAGSAVDVSGPEGAGGTLLLRADREGQDVAVDPLAGEVRGARQVLVQGGRRYQADAVDAALAAALVSDASAWLTGEASVRQRLAGSSPALAPLLLIGAGMEVASAGDLAVRSPVDLAGAAGAGHLSLVAARDLTVEASLSDGFASRLPGAALLGGPSAGLSLRAGRDVVLAPGTLVRTGTGDIAVRAGRNLELRADGAGRSALYTAGRRPGPAASLGWAPGFGGAPAGMPLGEFPIGGGDVDLETGGSLLGRSATQATSAWLYRYGAATWDPGLLAFRVDRQTSWSILFPGFAQGVGALGGGDVRVRARGDVEELQVAIPTTGQLTTAAGAVAREADLVVRGGGDLTLSAGRDLRGGLFVLGRGQADLRAGGAVAGGTERLLRADVDAGALAPRAVAPLFGLMDATVRVTAASAATVEGAFDPTMQGQVRANLTGGTAGSAFGGYTERTALEVTALSGPAAYLADPWASADLSQGDLGVSMRGVDDNRHLSRLFATAPGSLRLASLGGDVLLGDRFGGTGTLRLAPAARGTLEALAQAELRIALRTVALEETAPASRRGPLHPYATVRAGDVDTVAVAPVLAAPTPLHAGDPEPVRLQAVTGSVCADRSGSCVPGTALAQLADPVLALPKPVEIRAGRDVYLGNYQVQHDGPGALSTIRAGRDLYDVGVQVSGPGTLLLEAGRDLLQHLLPGATDDARFATSAAGGIVYSKGNTIVNPATGQVTGANAALPADRAADVYLLAGRAGGVDFARFAEAYLDPANGQDVARTYLPELAGYLRDLGVAAGATDAERLAAFAALAPARRETFLTRIYFEELRAAGIEYNDPSSRRFQSYDRGLAAVRRLFPAAPPAGAGDVVLGGKLLASNAQGDVTILAPYGKVEVGTLFSPGPRFDGAGGVLTRRGGDIRIMSDQNVDLYTSRVFTLQGGDITMWTSRGSITAGTGSKTSVRSAPLTYTMSPAGVVAVNTFGLSTGAGIGVLDALETATDRPPSRLDLIAPQGEVNAGDAGIRVVGDLNIAAAVVVGIENIQSSGAAQGVPKVEAPNVGALTTASAVAQASAKEGVAQQAAAARTAAADLPSIITVEVVGYETTEEEERKRKKGTSP